LQALAFGSGLLTAIIWDFPAKNPQISLRETSDNRDVMFNFANAKLSRFRLESMKGELKIENGDGGI